MTGILDAPVREVVGRGVVTVDENATLHAAARHMAARGVSAAVVVRGARHLGLLTEREIVERVGAGADPSTYVAADAMTAPLVVAEAHHSVGQVLMTMAIFSTRHLPVRDGDGRLVGMVSLSDLLARLSADECSSVDLRDVEAEPARSWLS
jgi:CBS domain-containing protein